MNGNLYANKSVFLSNAWHSIIVHGNKIGICIRSISLQTEGVEYLDQKKL